MKWLDWRTASLGHGWFHAERRSTEEERECCHRTGVVHLVEHDPGESGGLIGRVWLELRVDLDDEGRGDGGEQTSLRPKSALAHPSNVYNLQISVVFKSSS